MIKFSVWLEDFQAAVGDMRSARGDLGSQGFEGMQDALKAMQLIAQNPRYYSAMIGIFNKLSAMVSQIDPQLATSLKTSGQKFLNAERSAGGKVAHATDAQSGNNTQQSQTNINNQGEK